MDQHHRVAIVGTGFSGLGMAVALKQRGIDFIVFERGNDVGGTWRDNTYPGCQCDVPSHLYSFSFDPNPDWSRTYSPQPEIFAYLRGTADRFDVRRHIRFDTLVLDASWSDDEQRWTIETSRGTHTADVLIGANGGLAEPSTPDITGLETFAGTVFHSAQWDHDHDLTGARVAVIGTGASSIQLVPKIQPAVGSLTLFQRTPAWVLPHTDRPISSIERKLYRRFPILQRAQRALVYWLREAVVVAMTKNPKYTKPISQRATRHLHKQVKDPVLRAKLLPAFDAGCKRLLLSDDYYPALTQPSVDVETSPIVEVREHSIVCADGTEHPVDTIICGTGFKVTNNPVMELIRNGDGLSLAKSWEQDGMRAYLGTTVPGFPNLFLMSGPNTGIGHTSLVVMIEAQIAYITDALRVMDERGATTIEVRSVPFEDYNAELHGRMAKTVWSTGGCVSWYMDAHGRNPTLWPDFTWKFRRKTRRFDPENYVLAVPKPSKVDA
jgi:cation diffusion facilitator CzcD-associated flavoprotein CzcO